MRANKEDILIAVNEEKNQRLWNLHKQLNEDIVFFKAKLNQLLLEIDRLHAQSDTGDLTQDYNTLSKYIAMLEKYLLSIQYSTKLGFIKINKMSDQDMTVLEAQALGVKKMRDWVAHEISFPAQAVSPSRSNAADVDNQSSHSTQSDRLSTLIDEAKTLDYNVSAQRIWMRRVGFVLGSLAVAAAAITLIAIMMTPAGSITAAVLIGLKIALPALLAFIGIGHPVTTTTNINMGGFNMPVTTPVPSTIGMLCAGAAGLFPLRKSGILNPQREEDTRNVQAATVNQLTDSLKKKINVIDAGEVKDFLLDVVNYADKLSNEGLSSFMHETQQGKMQKARVILRETAKMIEGEMPADIQTLLATPINGSRYTFSDLLNCQRNASTFWKTSSSFFNTIAGKYKSLKPGMINTVSFSVINVAL